jgi:putative glutamine amidotransferase
VDAVRRAGGSPIALPPGDRDPAHYLDLIDGLILAGGGDIDPQSYGGANHESVYSVCAERDGFEVTLVHAALARPELPVLCICRGMQVLNVALGGDLHVHIPDAIDGAIAHRKPERDPLDHRATVEADSRIGAILGATDLLVKSWHHQAVREVGSSLRAVAWAEDGVIEALEHQSHPWCMAVQWHPELQPDDPVQQRLFTALVTESAHSAPRSRASGAPRTGTDGGGGPVRGASSAGL